MKKYKKIIILTVISLSVYFIYLVTNKNNITVQEKPHIACREVLLFVDTWKAERYNQIRK